MANMSAGGLAPPDLGLDRGLSKNRSPAPRFDALRHDVQKIGLCLFRESTLERA
jgi:hypothetical protein